MLRPARVALLPLGWEMQLDVGTEQLYYWNAATGETAPVDQPAQR